ncbi:DNA-binding LytR/AlgR family response regulator [Pontibacter aydingkolensis]|uniref:LytTR family DNA-binding domain-containing protein n=1 Tax=Pontibacter aydingkolensis TaxID=1911536 RepID=A0ABS7CR81_9BACT|nr:LytTR family DNA-binding domain-containing protein [Pontibacter aydingkolensis]MBW7466330.1 LytTR family DNA-binding domain-containing protein [Pontibacter aydingkolensis]
MKIKCMIVDDEPLALDVLETFIERLDNLELVCRCNNAVEAYNCLQTHDIDLLFLDIQMPKLTGIDFLKTLSNPPKVIFTTAYRDYALEGFELNVVDYLLKPISFERFLKAVSKVSTFEATKPASTTTPATSLAGTTTTTDYKEAFIYLKADKKMVKVMLADILYIESLKDYIRVKTEGKEIISYQKISFLEEKLPTDKFLRVHRSFIVALDKIQAFSATAVDIGKTEIPIGRFYKNEVLQVLGKNNLLEA